MTGSLREFQMNFYMQLGKLFQSFEKLYKVNRSMVILQLLKVISNYWKKTPAIASHIRAFVQLAKTKKTEDKSFFLEMDLIQTYCKTVVIVSIISITYQFFQDLELYCKGYKACKIYEHQVRFWILHYVAIIVTRPFLKYIKFHNILSLLLSDFHLPYALCTYDWTLFSV